MNRPNTIFAYFPDVPQQYGVFPDTIRRSLPSGLPPSNHFNYQNQCRYDVQSPGSNPPYSNNYYHGLRLDGWYGVSIVEQTEDGVRNGVRWDSPDGRGSYSFTGCLSSSAPYPVYILCSSAVTNVRFSGPNPEDASGRRVGDYGTPGENRPARSGRLPTDQTSNPVNSRPTPTTVFPNQGVWALPDNTGRAVVSNPPSGTNYANPTTWGPGWYNPRTLPREPWFIRQNGAMWRWQGTFGDAFNARGANLFGLRQDANAAANINSLAAVDSCGNQTALFPNIQHLYGYGNYEVQYRVENVTTCLVWVYPSFGTRLFRGCNQNPNEPRTENRTEWIISECQASIRESATPDSTRNFDPSDCIGSVSATWSSPTGLAIPESMERRADASGETIMRPITVNGSGANTPTGILAPADGSLTRIRYPNLTMQVNSVTGPQVGSVPGRELNESFGTTTVTNGHSTTKWLIWRVGGQSTPWALSLDARRASPDGTRLPEVSNPNSLDQPFRTRVGIQDQKLTRFGTGVTSSRLTNGVAERNEGSRKPKDIGEAADTWSEGRRTLNIWFQDASSYPARNPFYASSSGGNCSIAPAIMACQTDKEFATRVHFFQMFAMDLAEGSVRGLRGGAFDEFLFDRSGTNNTHRNIVVGQVFTEVNSLKVLEPRTIPSSTGVATVGPGGTYPAPPPAPPNVPSPVQPPVIVEPPPATGK